MQKFIDLITRTPTFEWDRRVSGRIALPRSNCVDVAGVLALSVATKHCHWPISPLTPRLAAADIQRFRVINW